MVDQCPFVLKVLTWVDNNNFPFQQYLKITCDLFTIFLLLNNSLNNKWFDFKIPFQSVYTIIPSLTCSPIGYLKPIVIEFYHVPTLGQAFGLQFDNFFSLSIIFLKFLNVFWTPTSFNCKYFSMCVHISHRLYGCPSLTLHPWQWVRRNPWCSLRHFCHHCMRCWFPCGMKTTTCTSFSMFNYSCWWIDIVFTKDEIHTLIKVIIVDPRWMDLFFLSCATQGFYAFHVIQAKKRRYCDQCPIDQFLPLIIEIFGCLHK